MWRLLHYKLIFLGMRRGAASLSVVKKSMWSAESALRRFIETLRVFDSTVHSCALKKARAKIAYGLTVWLPCDVFHLVGSRDPPRLMGPCPWRSNGDHGECGLWHPGESDYPNVSGNRIREEIDDLRDTSPYSSTDTFLSRARAFKASTIKNFPRI